jgi:membrane-associated protease RseP (regulator of RpoE activity)
MPTLVAIAVLALLIFVHELGHFLAARSQGIHVNRFSIGFGPILLKYQGEKTEYALRGIPLGGFVGFPDDDPESDIPADDPDLLRNRPILDRAIVISAGVIANLIFAYLLLVGQVAVAGMPDFVHKPGVAIPQVMTEASSPATRAGLQSGDLILAVNGQTLDASESATSQLITLIQTSPDQPLTLEVQRNGLDPAAKDQPIVNLTVVPELDTSGKGRIGVKLAPNGEIIRRHASSGVEVFTASASEFQRIFSLTLQGFGRLASNFRETAEQVAGPVAIVAMGADIARSDATNLLQFAALISINLAIINILPLPALDGGQIAFLALEALRGKPIPTKIQDSVMQTGLVLILGLGIFLIVRDTVNLDWVQHFFQQ